MSSADSPNGLELAARIRKARDLAMLSQIELANQLGVSERTLQGWEAATSFPQPRFRRKVVAWLVEFEKGVAA